MASTQSELDGLLTTSTSTNGPIIASNFIESIGAGRAICEGEMLDIVVCECCCLNNFEQELRKDSPLENALVFWKGNPV